VGVHQGTENWLITHMHERPLSCRLRQLHHGKQTFLVVTPFVWF
jgi:hypothetical protein